MTQVSGAASVGLGFWNTLSVLFTEALPLDHTEGARAKSGNTGAGRKRLLLDGGVSQECDNQWTCFSVVNITLSPWTTKRC